MSSKKNVPSGSVFYHWTVMGDAPATELGQTRFLCKCDCGTERMIVSSTLRSGRSKSCGCWGSTVRALTHGQARKGNKSGTYNSWAHMISRCYNKNNKVYRWYGARGITVCDKWKNSFEEFFKDMGVKPAKGHAMSIDRIDNDKGYFPENCRWATPIQQANNTSRSRRNKCVSLDIQ